jgi:hypothetical protein
VSTVVLLITTTSTTPININIITIIIITHPMEYLGTAHVAGSSPLRNSGSVQHASGSLSNLQTIDDHQQ